MAKSKKTSRKKQDPSRGIDNRIAVILLILEILKNFNVTVNDIQSFMDFIMAFFIT